MCFGEYIRLKKQKLILARYGDLMTMYDSVALNNNVAPILFHSTFNSAGQGY